MNYKEFFNTDNKSGWKCVERKLANKHPEIHQLVCDFAIKHGLNELPFVRKVYHFINDLKVVPVCCECGKAVKFLRLNTGYQEFCCVTCANKSSIKIQRMKDTLLEEYGVAASFHIPSVKESIIKKNIENYGVDNPFKSKEIQKRIQENNLINYGFITPAKNEDIQRKIKETNIRLYNVNSYVELPSVIEKRKAASLELFGNENPLLSVTHKEIFDEKRKKTCLTKFGSELYIKSEKAKKILYKYNLENYNSEYSYGSSIFRAKFLGKTSKIETRVANEIGGEHKFIYANREFDIKCGNDVFEVDGDFYHVSKLENLGIIQVGTSLNDYYKIKLIEDSEYNLYKIKVSDIEKLDVITIDNLKNIAYTPDYSVSYTQKIVTKEYFKNYLETKGPDKLSKYLPLFLKFVRTFQPEFPYPDTTDKLADIVSNIQNFDFTRFHNTETNEFNNQTSVIGCTYLKSIFKSFWESSYKTNISPVDIWKDDSRMLKIIAYRIGLNNSNEVYDFSMRNLVRGISAVRGSVSFFKPLIAAGIYKHYLGDIENPRVFDPCCGFGGRLLGFKSIYPNGIYEGCEPNNNTHNELIELGGNFSGITIYKTKLEEHTINNDYDLCFTSIPYFDLEDYKNGVSYLSFDDWRDKFINPLLNLKRLVVNMPYDLCVVLGLEEYIDGYLVNQTTHFNKIKGNKKEVLIKLNF